MLKISYAGCHGLSPAISAQFTLEMHVAAQNCKKSLKPPILGVQGHSMSSMLTFPRSSLPVLVMISSMSVRTCIHVHVKRVNNDRITPFKGCPFFSPRSWRPPSPSGMKFCHKLVETLFYHTVKTRCLYLTWS